MDCLVLWIYSVLLSETDQENVATTVLSDFMLTRSVHTHAPTHACTLEEMNLPYATVHFFPLHMLFSETHARTHAHTLVMLIMLLFLEH